MPGTYYRVLRLLSKSLIGQQRVRAGALQRSYCTKLLLVWKLVMLAQLHHAALAVAHWRKLSVWVYCVLAGSYVRQLLPVAGAA